MRLDVRGLRSGYGKLEVLDGLDITAGTGRCVAVIGPNGAGKSTLLNTLAGLVKPSNGTVRLGDQDVTGLAPHRLVELGMALAPEGRHLFPDLSVRENLVVAERIGAQRRARLGTRDIRSLFPILAERASVPAGRLSGGEQQMLTIGRTLMLGPAMMLLDEPSIGLAPRIVREVMDTVKGLVDDDFGVVVVEQNAREALRIADYAYVLENGRIVREGDADDLLAHSDLRRDYLGV